MIARSLFPSFSSRFANGTQILVSPEPFSFGIAMLPDERILARWDEHLGIGRMLVEAIIYLALVVTAIASKTVNRLPLRIDIVGEIMATEQATVDYMLIDW